jgi:hypothetical protein
MTAARKLTLLFLLLAAVLPLAAQRRRDPLTDAETDQLREAAQEPNDRLKLWVKFIRAREVALDQVRSDPKFTAERAQRVHDLLEDLSNMVDEMDDNIDNYVKDKADARKGLKEAVELCSELQVKLRALKEAPATEAAATAELRAYKFVLENALDSVNASADSSREALQQQNEQFAKKKDEKKKKK